MADAARDGEAVEAAKRIDELLTINTGQSRDDAWDIVSGNITSICRALISLSSRLETAREEMKEECAKVVSEVCEQMSDCSPWHIAAVIEGRIRSLPSLSVK